MGYGIGTDRGWKRLIVFAVFGGVMAGVLVVAGFFIVGWWLWQHLAWV